MKATTTTLAAAVWMATAAATTALAGPAHADPPTNLRVTDDVRTQLVQAGATLTGRPASEFTGLEPGRTYYAVMPSATNPTYWAAAALSGPKSQLAAINLQDQNSYMFFRKAADPAATWVPIAAGFGPISAGEQPCPIPQSVRELWQWPAGKCYPPPRGRQ
jgi:hypothetical protein